ncbi:MAG: CDP-alcohol phosphatidyltransferase family protein [Pseudonocardia sp.]|nr:CDP-alcohol phosphatidyltransferase family protein [Pseudonocardia sp.]
MTTTHITARAPRVADPDLTAAVGAQLVLLSLLWVGADLGPVGWVTGLGYLLGLQVLLGRARRAAGRRELGPADRVTLGRAVLVGGVAALVADGLAGQAPPVPVLVALAAVALVLDAVDGRVARRTGTASALGARFDMETDAILILVLSAHVAAGLGGWVLAIGLMRYALVAATWLVPWMRATVPPTPGAKTVAAAQGVVLVLVSAALLPVALAAGLTALALGALTWSFGRDVVWLAGNRRAFPAQRQAPRS